MQICRLLLVIRRFHVILKLNAPKDRVNQGLKSCPGRKIKHLACDKIFSQQKSTQKGLTKSNKMLNSSANIIVLFPVPFFPLLPLAIPSWEGLGVGYAFCLLLSDTA
jgi:hypothetical protein